MISASLLIFLIVINRWMESTWTSFRCIVKEILGWDSGEEKDELVFQCDRGWFTFVRRLPQAAWRADHRLYIVSGLQLGLGASSTKLSGH